jgi:two-component system, OmpR family, alkaline phosphatase synthesis response regulator PhoP
MSKKRVLIVEDTEDIAQLVKIALEEMSLEVTHVNNGTKALAYLEVEHTDLIVLDIGLPGISGWQVLDAIKSQRSKERYHVIVLTALTDSANRVIGKFQDVDAYLNKPFDVRQLKQIVHELLTDGETSFKE